MFTCDKKVEVLKCEKDRLVMYKRSQDKSKKKSVKSET